MNNNRKKKNLSADDCKRLIQGLLLASSEQDGKRRLARGAAQQFAEQFGISRVHVFRLWKKALKRHEDTGIYSVSPTKKGNSGRPAVYDRGELMEALEDLDCEERGTIRQLADRLGISVGLVHSLVRDHGMIFPHTNAIKTYLTEQNKLHRVMYAAGRIEQQNNEPVYSGAFNEVHVDEKWFFISQKSQRIYLSEQEARREQDKHKRTAKHKSHIIKVMFLAAVARPRFNEDGECVFDGKIGIWPLVKRLRAKRSSVNRQAGTIETKTMSCDRKVYKKFMIEKVLPAVFAKFPRDDRSTEPTKVWIQQDNAPAHFADADPDWFEACDRMRSRWTITLVEQPPNSPDTNVLDLGFFVSLQADVWKLKRANTIDGLIANVKTAWQGYDPHKLNRTFLTHACCLDQIIKYHGDNNYKIPHMKKQHLERHGQLPLFVRVSQHVKDVLEEQDIL